MGDGSGQTFAIGGDRSVRRLGFGAMRVTGEGIWGWPADVEEAKRLLRRVVKGGVDLIDTADSYGPEISEYLIAAALRPYPEHVVIATKGGMTRGGPGDWTRDGRPEHLARAVHNSLRRLELERIDLYQLHAIDKGVPLEDSLGALKELQDAGKIRHIGVSNFKVDEIKRAREVVDVVTVQNRYNLADRAHEAVVEYCSENGIGFLPWKPLGTGELPNDPRFRRIADDLGATSSQVALAWLLKRSPVMLPIPGTGSAAHFEENTGARDIELSDEHLRTLDQLTAVRGPAG